MKKIATKFVLAATATFFAGAVMAQTDTTAAPIDTTVTPDQPVVDTVTASPETEVPDTTVASPNAITGSNNTVSLAAAFSGFTNNFYAITNKELLGSKQFDIKSEEEEA